MLLVFTDVAEATCADPMLGSFTYREATFFVPVWGKKNGAPVLALHVPFIYPNEGLAVAAGREVYGLPKKPAAVEMPDFDLRLADASKMRVEVANLASVPIGQVLGLDPIVTPILAATLTMDFLFEPGSTWVEVPEQDDPPSPRRACSFSVAAWAHSRSRMHSVIPTSAAPNTT